jgi:DNA-binding FadR family transcriptional regulator
MQAAEDGHDNTLDADIAFHVAVLKASNNPFYGQFQDVVATALRSSIQFTNRIKGHSASITDHAAVRDAIARKKPEAARIAMRKIIGDVLDLIDTTATTKKPTTRKRKS